MKGAKGYVSWISKSSFIDSKGLRQCHWLRPMSDKRILWEVSRWVVTDTGRDAVEFSLRQAFGSFCFDLARAQAWKNFPENYWHLQQGVL
jgi:hypothetical protein